MRSAITAAKARQSTRPRASPLTGANRFRAASCAGGFSGADEPARAVVLTAQGGLGPFRSIICSSEPLRSIQTKVPKQFTAVPITTNRVRPVPFRIWAKGVPCPSDEAVPSKMTVGTTKKIAAISR